MAKAMQVISLDDAKALLKDAYEKGKQAGIQSTKQEKTPYQKTEARLYALPALVKKVYCDMEELARLEGDGEMEYAGMLPERSKDLARFSRYGSRVPNEDKLAAVIMNLKATIATDEHEIAEVRAALENIKDEYYFPTISAKYFDKKSDADMAKDMYCDERTIRRQRSRLIKDLSVFLYGSVAI
jgi:ribosome modulation factor